ncbi:hypothetical protein [Pseudomonas sp. 22 E 5]|nr:hypothetical protein [Pseudomonas sp. 22 E 5]
MTRVHRSRLTTSVTPTEPTRQSLQAAPENPAAAKVVGLFQARQNGQMERSQPEYAENMPKHAPQRLLDLLSYTVTEEQPSLAEQISQLVQGTGKSLTDEAVLHNEVERLLNQPSALNPQKTYTQLIDEILQNPSRAMPNKAHGFSRVRRELGNAAPAQNAGDTAVQQFANALVEDSDSQLAINFANHLIRIRVNATPYSLASAAPIAIPPSSTFGLAWNELADALDAEPFKTFAQTKGIDISSLVIKANGDLTGRIHTQTFSFSLTQDPEWANASSAVLTASNKMRGDITFRDRGHAPAEDVAGFYLERNSRFNSDDTLMAIDRLMRERNFSSISNTDSYYAARYVPVQERQKDAKQQLANLPPSRLNRLLADFAPASAAQKIKDADQALARLSSQAIGTLSGFTIEELPEYSTFNLVRNNLKEALNGVAFTAFAKEQNLDVSSVRIFSEDGTLIGKVNGVDTTFVLNGLSGWSDVWPQVQPAVERMATGSGDYVYYPSARSAEVSEVLRFYAEEGLPRNDFPKPGWERRVHEASLRRSAKITQVDGFKALVGTPTDDARSLSVRAAQQAVIVQLTGKPLHLTPLETLAAAAKANVPQTTPAPPVNAAPGPDTPEDTLARAEAELVGTTHRVMLELKSDPTPPASKKIAPIPANSLFGQWQAYLDKALKSSGFTEWAAKQGIDLSALRFDPTDRALIGKVGGVEQRFTATDFTKKYPEAHFDVLTPVLTAAEAFTAHGKPITLAQANDSSASFEWVANFYSISTDYGSEAFTRHTELMGRTLEFPTPPENPRKIVSWLNQRKTALGDSNDRYALIHQLKSGNVDNDATTGFTVDPDSSHQPKGTTTLQKFLSDHGWYGATWAAQVDNLLLALQTEIPQAPPLGNQWGFLSTDLPLSAEQRDAVGRFVKTAIGNHGTLLSFLSSGVSHLSSDPDQALQQLLASDIAQELAANLQTAMKGAATPTSLKQWLLTAVVLELDPTAGTQRNIVAGFDFMWSGRWGYGADKMHEWFSQNLAKTKEIPANLLPAVTRLLMSGAAPHLLVKDLPSTLKLGSTEWLSFSTAVNLIELLSAGASANMTYQQVMDFHKIKPISADENRLHAIAQLNPVIDWAVINNHLVKNDNDEYSLEQLNDSQEKLNTQIKETSQAKRYLRTFEPPSRRAMALAALKEKFGSAIDFERPVLWEKVAGGLFSGIHASIVEVYEAGRLGESWRTHQPGLNFEDLRKKAHELPDINEQFDKAIQPDFTQRRASTISLFKDMLSKLPLEERNSLNFGAVELLQVEGAAGGIIITSVYEGVRRDFAVYPATGQIVKIPDIDPLTPLDKKVRIVIDMDALKNGTEPKQGVTSDVVLRESEQFILIERADDDKRPELRERLFLERPASDTSSVYDGERMEDLAKVLVDTAYLRKSTFVATHRGLHNAVEQGVEPSDFFKGLLRALPGGSSLEDIYHGEYVKAAGDLLIDIALYVATEGAGKIWTLAKTGVAWATAKVSDKFVEKFGAEEAESIALKDVSAASTSNSINSLSRMQDSRIAEYTADMADGRVIRSDIQNQVKVTTVLQDGKWYAYDAKTQTAYGPALEGFISDTSAPLRQETFSSGTQALVTEKPLAADAYSLPRAHGFDLVNEGKVYRYDARNPNVLTDLESADHFKPLDKVEAICEAPSVGGRAKRGANDACFSKIIGNTPNELTQELQALEHVRLFPSPSKLFRKDQFVVFERRRYQVIESETGPQLHPTLDNKPITYKSLITGSIKHDPQFGLYVGQTNEALNQETRVIKLNSISDISDDKREVRAVIVNGRTLGDTEKYLVIEADTAQFYYAKLNTTASGELTFFKTTPNDLSLVNGYRNKFSTRQGVSRTPLDAEFIALPKLDSALAELKRSGYQKKDVDELGAFVKNMTKEQQREVLYQLQRSEAIGKANIALKPNQVTALTTPANFSTLTAEQQNTLLAQQVKDTVTRSMTATGLGPGNRIRSASDIARADAASQTVEWLRRSIPSSARNRSDMILKAGAGNCGEMALLSRDIIKKSGGNAYEWAASDAHAFTVVGGPSGLPAATVDFSEPEWTDAWVVDPWAGIASPAREYTQKLKAVMTQWERDGIKIVDGNKTISPLDKDWMGALITKPKTPYPHGYINP